MINFRWHRNSLEDSLATSVSFATNASFTRYIQGKCQLMHLRIFDEHRQSTIRFNDYGYDSRCNQHLKAVYVDEIIIGFIFE